ncbi:MAG: ABC transporter ATP-binding protein [Alphaproteobacteria bacterium]|nr:ABC transporter ATP-binding protein [Alphaproteobacteria bacterium]
MNADIAVQEKLLEVDGLSATFRSNSVRALRDVSFRIDAGEVVALVGESGSGKSTTGLAIMGLLERGEASLSGSIRLVRKSGERAELVGLAENRMRSVRGNDVAMIFQEPMSSLDPIYSVGDQIAEAIAAHQDLPRARVEDEALRLLTIMAIPDPAKCFVSYPHQLSGGMRQRVMIAMALSCRPRLLVADEPTTALDVTIQAQIIDQLGILQRDAGMAVLFVTHDLGLAADLADRVLVMYAGQIVEAGPADQVFSRPTMPYTAGLMRSRPRIGAGRAAGGQIQPIPGGVPDLARLPTGCTFHPRCAHAVTGRCDVTLPALEPADGGRAVRCLRWREITP